MNELPHLNCTPWGGSKLLKHNRKVFLSKRCYDAEHMSNKKDEKNDKDDQDFWNIIYSALFLVFFLILLVILYKVRGSLPTSISFFDLSLIVLATFRLTRLFVYDKITRFLRDAFFVSSESYTEEGVTYFGKKENTNGQMRTIYELLTCPWCFSVWAATVVSFFYFLTPLAWLPIFILAISGIASFIQLVSNMIGWHAENAKIRATKG